jgi:hypothetical protein
MQATFTAEAEVTKAADIAAQQAETDADDTSEDDE